MRVVLSDDALVDVQTIGDEIAKHNPIRAASYIDEILAACYSLGQQPERCPLTPQFGKSVRRLLFGEYSVFYRVRERNVQISRILHGKRRVKRSMVP
jgi:toxin ParE1/3/4